MCQGPLQLMPRRKDSSVRRPALLTLGCESERAANASSNSTECLCVSTTPSVRTVLAEGQYHRRTSRSEHDFVAPPISRASKCRLGSISNLEKSLDGCFVIHFQVVSHNTVREFEMNRSGAETKDTNCEISANSRCVPVFNYLFLATQQRKR